ncbi:MAG: 3-deoxy-manno-octulosonate cytidylyltransferase [Cardiobacteriaceae bacterium]|nr:3-deoxy-manno-octulosonate cytidylyltransferase [Cardiobacteriaceae bacterium]
MDTVVVIPARYGSTRLAAKPLRLIAGVPMVVRTARQAVASGLPVWVAYDDERIGALLLHESVQGITTRSDHENGTERLCEVAMRLGWSDETIVVNVQGDEPLLAPSLITYVAETLVRSPQAAVATLAAPFDHQHSPVSATTVKVVCDNQGMALYFSRAVIPHVRDTDDIATAFPYLRHIGIYAYRVSALKCYPQLSATPLEQAEKLEQLRFLEHGLRIAVGTIDVAPPPGVDCEEDLQRVEALLKQHERSA